jgi:hypothetical protein
VPRHPPCALSSLATKMLASTVQFSNNKQPPPPTHTNPTTNSANKQCWWYVERRACHQKKQPDPPPTTQAEKGAQVRSLRTQQDVHEPHPPTPTPIPHPPHRSGAPTEAGEQAVLGRSGVNQKDPQARFHIIEPCPSTRTVEPDTDLNPTPRQGAGLGAP